jgi:hypothetical protein
MAISKQLRVPLRIVFYREDGHVIAHCLEFDLVGDGETNTSALARLANAMALQIQASVESGNPANLFSPADGKFFRMFAEGSDIAQGELQISAASQTQVVIEDIEYREYSSPAEDRARV